MKNLILSLIGITILGMGQNANSIELWLRNVYRGNLRDTAIPLVRDSNPEIAVIVNEKDSNLPLIPLQNQMTPLKILLGDVVSDTTIRVLEVESYFDRHPRRRGGNFGGCIELVPLIDNDYLGSHSINFSLLKAYLNPKEPDQTYVFTVVYYEDLTLVIEAKYSDQESNDAKIDHLP